MTDTANPTATLPNLNWKKASCEVCGETFDYIKKRRPHTCNKGDCQYKYQYRIDEDTWATHQPDLFEA